MCSDRRSRHATWVGLFRTRSRLKHAWVRLCKTCCASSLRGFDYARPRLRVKRAWVRCVTTYGSVSATWGLGVTTHAFASVRGFGASQPTDPLVLRGGKLLFRSAARTPAVGSGAPCGLFLSAPARDQPALGTVARMVCRRPSATVARKVCSSKSLRFGFCDLALANARERVAIWKLGEMIVTAYR